MPNGIISKEEFEKITQTDIKLNILFGTIVSYTDRIDARFEAGNQRFKKLENRKLIDKVYATIGGVIGGILATFGIKWGN